MFQLYQGHSIALRLEFSSLNRQGRASLHSQKKTLQGLPEECKRGKHDLCVLARSGDNRRSGHEKTAGHGRSAQYGRRTANYGKPASHGHMMMMKKKKQKEDAEKDQDPANPSSSKPSRNCIALLSEKQPLRLHNNVAIFENAVADLSNTNQLSPQEPSASTQKFPRLDWEQSLSFANGDCQFSSSNAKLRSDFSAKLLDIMTSFKKKDGRTNDVNFQGGIESQPATEISPHNKVFISPGFQSRLAQAMETPPEVVDEMPSAGIQHDMTSKDFLSEDNQHDLPSEDTQALEESDFSSDSSDDDGYGDEIEHMQSRFEAGTLSLQNKREHYVSLEGKGRFLSASMSPVLTGKGRGYVSPRHLSWSTGSRSSPSQSSIPGRRSKYSKPDPKAKQGSTSVSRSIKAQKPSQPLPKSKKDTELHAISELKGEDDEDNVTVTSFRKSQAQEACEPEENISFDWSDSDPEDDPEDSLPSATAVPFSVEEWSSCSDDEEDVSPPFSWMSQTQAAPRAEESISPDWYDSDAEDDAKNGLASATTPHPESPLWKNHPLSNLPFEIQYSYSETPNAPILGYREHYSPFGPATMQRPWTGSPPLRRRRNLQGFESFNPTLQRKKGFTYGLYPEGQAQKPEKTREEILGKPLTQEEIIDLVQECHQENRQVDLGRDGLTHNMLNLIHTHWMRRPVCRIKCKGVPTVDMDNVCFHVKEKTGGQIIYRTGGVLYVFRGRNYSYKHRPRIPLMLWKPASPVYPKLVPQAPAGLTNEEAYQLRILGQKVEPLCKLRKNGVFLDLVKDVRDAFRVDDLVSLNYEGLKSSDYKKIGAKLRDLVPCVLLSFRNQRIVMWKGRDLESSSVVDTKEDIQCTNASASDTKLMVLCNEMLLSDPSIVYPHSEESKQNPHPAGDLDSIDEYSNMIDSSDSDDSISDMVLERPVQSERPPQKWEAVRNSDFTVLGQESVEASISLGRPFKIDSLQQHEIVALSDVPVLSEYFPLSWDEHRELCVRFAGEEGGQDSDSSDTKPSYTPFPVYGMAGEGFHEQEYPSIPPPSSQWGQWNSRHRPKSLFGEVDVLWEVALKYGMAVELEDADLEADLVLQKATVLSEVASARPEYTEKLVNRLRLKREYEKAEKRFEIQFGGRRRQNQAKRNKPAKWGPCLPAVEMPGLQADDLAKILAPNRR